jgi:hypothetical protein
MVDLMREETIDLAAAARELPGKPHPATIWRWYRHGLRGQRLETVVVGGRRFTSREALARFVEAITRARTEFPTQAPLAAAIAGQDAVDRDMAARAAEAGRRLRQRRQRPN